LEEEEEENKKKHEVEEKNSLFSFGLLYLASHMMPWLGSMFFPMHTIIVSHQILPFCLPFLFHDTRG